MSLRVFFCPYMLNYLQLLATEAQYQNKIFSSGHKCKLNFKINKQTNKMILK